VVVGTAPGSKLERAKQLGVTIIDEAHFKKLVG
jgi:NAD-dependent DNA ligase